MKYIADWMMITAVAKYQWWLMELWRFFKIFLVNSVFCNDIVLCIVSVKYFPIHMTCLFIGYCFLFLKYRGGASQTLYHHSHYLTSITNSLTSGNVSIMSHQCYSNFFSLQSKPGIKQQKTCHQRYKDYYGMQRSESMRGGNIQTYAKLKKTLSIGSQL